MLPSLSNAVDLEAIECHYTGSDNGEFCKSLNRMISQVSDVTVVDMESPQLTVEYEGLYYFVSPWMVSDSRQPDAIRVSYLFSDLLPQDMGSIDAFALVNSMNSYSGSLKVYFADSGVALEVSHQFVNLLRASDLMLAIDRLKEETSIALKALEELDKLPE